jgi:very-short-patch-repair endonuclease
VGLETMNKKVAIETARELRKNPTLAEKLLWDKLRKRQVDGLKFLRQYPIFFNYDNRDHFFIVDFYCHSKKLVIELDGDILYFQKEYDFLRESILIELGFKVCRMNNLDLLKRIDWAIDRIRQY